MVGDGWRGDTFLITPRSIKALSSIGLQGQPGRSTNDKATSWGTTSAIGHKFGIHFSHVRKQSSCGPFGKRRLQLKNGGLILHQQSSLSCAFYIFSLLNMSKSFKQKLWDCIQANRAFQGTTFIKQART